MQNGLSVIPRLDLLMDNLFYCPKNSKVNTNRTNILKLENGYQIQMQIPGYQKNNVDIEVLGRKINITLKGENNKVNKENYILQEFNLETLSKQFTLPEDVNENNIEAQLENGILFVNLQVVTNKRKIPIN